MRLAKRFGLCLALGLSLAPVGCGSKLASVTGRVVYPDNTPFTDATVIFNPADGNPLAGQGHIQANGEFRLGTTRPGEGVLPGKYRVVIQPDDDNAGKIEILSVAAGSNDFTITVQKPAKKKRG
jgi:hypothetical protein